MHSFELLLGFILMIWSPESSVVGRTFLILNPIMLLYFGLFCWSHLCLVFWSAATRASFFNTPDPPVFTCVLKPRDVSQDSLPFGVPPVEVHEVSGLDAPSTGEPAAGRGAQRTPLHGHVQTLGVVHRLRHHAAWGGGGRVGILARKRRLSRRGRGGGARRLESRGWGRHKTS